MQLAFMGETSTVTGSKDLLGQSGHRLLIGCGLFQGRKPLRLCKWEPLPVPPPSIDAVVLSPAHLDDSGDLRRLRAGGSSTPGDRVCAAAAPLRTLVPEFRQAEELG